MELKKFVDILGKSLDEAFDFFEKEGKNVFKDNKILLEILSEKWGEKQYNKLFILSQIIHCEYVNRNIYKKKHYGVIHSIYKNFREYMRLDMSFIGVPFLKWGDLQKEHTALLKVLIKEGKLENFEKDPRFKKLGRKKGKRREEIIKDHPHLENRYGMY